MRLIKGDIAAIRFLDHVEGGGKAMDFTVYGRVVQVNGRQITIDSWAWTNPRRRFDKHNVTRFVIVKSAITDVTKLTPEHG